MTATLLNAGRLSQHAAHLHHDPVRTIQEVARSEAKQPDAGSDESVLAPVVLRKTRPVGASVIFKAEPMIRVVEVRPP
jgi:hypothetical protein